ncbi:hypothetical protein QQS21_008152 [Conoideocrella luteorostrata]|uniref:Uncharacterized protein n=1 Tax=Conoideocrella luteorostrata TaxID=1105319 RepID=A0AAJ0CLR5_9HYPO|nr:hypothetical protein QQS21_008152 [Conoideocrella luteorostrata]
MNPERVGPSLNGQVALITGAGRGIGKAISLAFARAGANVVCLARSISQIEEVVQEIRRSNLPDAIAISADVSRGSDLREAVARVTEKFGKIDILVNNAGVDRVGSLQYEHDFQAWWQVFEVNMKGPAALIHLVLPGMLDRDRGTIINIGSRNAISNHPFMTAYSASKTALLRFNQCLGLELKGSKVCTFYLHPGHVATSLMNGSFDTTEAAKIPRLKTMLDSMHATMENSDPKGAELAAKSAVMLASVREAYLLNGLYIDAQQDLSEILSLAQTNDH